MYGRYGMDQLGRFLFAIVMILLVVSMFVPSRILYLFTLVMVVISYFRMLSRNIPKRYAENEKYLKLTSGIRKRFATVKRDMAIRKTHHLYKCPSCSQKIKVPKGKGTIVVTCPKCKTEFTKKS